MVAHAQRRIALEARLSELDKRVHALDDALDQPKSRDWEDSAIEREGDQVMEKMGQAGLSEIRMIRAALARIDAGTYGECSECGAEISDERLDLLPFTPFCRDCAAKHDHH